jgi:hypothetical protein
MSWDAFLKTLSNRPKYGLTFLEAEVMMCLQETQCSTKSELLEAYIKSYSTIEKEAFTQRLKNIYKNFKL